MLNLEISKLVRYKLVVHICMVFLGLILSSPLQGPRTPVAKRRDVSTCIKPSMMDAHDL